MTVFDTSALTRRSSPMLRPIENPPHRTAKRSTKPVLKQG
jgi:hypothetical protein